MANWNEATATFGNRMFLKPRGTRATLKVARMSCCCLPSCCESVIGIEYYGLVEIRAEDGEDVSQFEATRDLAQLLGTKSRSRVVLVIRSPELAAIAEGHLRRMGIWKYIDEVRCCKDGFIVNTIADMSEFYLPKVDSDCSVPPAIQKELKAGGLLSGLTLRYFSCKRQRNEDPSKRVKLVLDKVTTA